MFNETRQKCVYYLECIEYYNDSLEVCIATGYPITQFLNCFIFKNKKCFDKSISNVSYKLIHLYPYTKMYLSTWRTREMFWSDKPNFIYSILLKVKWDKK